MTGPTPILPSPKPLPHTVPTPNITPPDPVPVPAPSSIRMAALQAIRAKAMAHTVGVEYDQPVHPFLAELLPDQPDLHRQVALPGAIRAVSLEDLNAFHAAGLTTPEIVKTINGIWNERLAARHQQFLTWRDGDRAEHIAYIREREAKKQAYMAAKAAEIEAELDGNEDTP